MDNCQVTGGFLAELFQISQAEVVLLEIHSRAEEQTINSVV